MENKRIIQSANLHALSTIAENLGELREELVFLGGCATALFITDDAASDVRVTQDIDCIVDVISLAKYYEISDKLRKKGFSQSSEDEVICRWHINNMILDVMPTDENILGFGNIWYKAAIKNSIKIKVLNKNTIQVVSVPYFLATKLEAFKNRGNLDYLSSHDLEDIITVIDGRPEILNDIKKADKNIMEYLSKEFGQLLNNPKFIQSLPGHLNYGLTREEREKSVINRIKEISKK